MSHDPFDPVEEALKTYVRDNFNGEVLTHYFVVCAAVIPDQPDKTAYHYSMPDDIPMHASFGLIEMAKQQMLDARRSDLE